ncbi:undecaprenyl-phosphate glucose phosphotransferase [Arachidicoccus ginsenosidimutans]|uniref:undecaprenyl-phosphate glucose phosphotransferase n=1 Tax=Arachidicoccus sp. BS20 TaxID=1850526 RepID=UPI0007F08D44|nr:undecaprenyl-phosphate glucose phosphotransferase [Arachidicoccus sp. BS20]ANI88878.1 undecaprenyl-phosphate glucose phosphotransferase [Arachidicoccus sp. BS20]
MQKFFTRLQTYMLVFDIIALNISLLASFLLLKGADSIVSINFLTLFIFFNFMWVTLTVMRRVYDDFSTMDSTVIMRNSYRIYTTYITCTCVFLLLIAMRTQHRGHFYFFLFLLSSLFFALALVFLRVFMLGLRKKLRKKIKPNLNIVVIGNKQVAERMYNAITDVNVVHHYNVMGIFSQSDFPRNGHPSHSLYKGDVFNCIDFIRTNRVHEVFCSIREVSAENVSRLMKEADKQMIRVKFLLDYEDIIQRPGKVYSKIGELPVMTIREEPLEDSLNRQVKRLFDIAFSLFVLIFILSWLYPIMALLIMLESRGPAVFVQLRSGKDNKPFKCYKFRSMRKNKDAHTGLQATKDDKRLTKIGAFIRKTSIDELPQFWNVLTGDMSIVGPRPHMLAHTKKYKNLMDNYMVRHLLKPGITGWAQVNGCRGETKTPEEMKKRVQYDIDYLENWSFFLDLKIIFLTVWNTAKGEEKAY